MKKKFALVIAAGALGCGIAMASAQAAPAGAMAPLNLLEGQNSTQLVQDRHHRRDCRTVCRGHGHHRRCRRVCHRG